jgi:hypothetical protein
MKRKIDDDLNPNEEQKQQTPQAQNNEHALGNWDTIHCLRIGLMDTICDPKTEIMKFNEYWNSFWQAAAEFKCQPKALFKLADPQTHNTLLTLAVQYEKDEIVSVLLKKFKELQLSSLDDDDDDDFAYWINLKNTYGYSALDLAIKQKNEQTIRALLNAGADPEALEEALLEGGDRAFIAIAKNLLRPNEDKDYKIQHPTKSALQPAPQNQYHAILTRNNPSHTFNLTFRLEEVKGDGSCMFLANGITRNYWVDFLQYCLKKWKDDQSNVENFKSLLLAIRNDILTMFENDFALIHDNKNLNNIEEKQVLYNNLYAIQKKIKPDLPPSPYLLLSSAFRSSIYSNNWTVFDAYCDQYDMAYVHLELYRCDSYEKLKFWPSIGLMTQFAQMRHQFLDSNNETRYHVIWEQKDSQNKQLSLRYPPIEDFLSWFKSSKLLTHSVFHISNVHFNKLILLTHNINEESKIENMEIEEEEEEEDNDQGMLEKAIALSTSLNNQQPKISFFTTSALEFASQNQYNAILTSMVKSNHTRIFNLTFDLKEVKDAESCLFLANGITREDWVNFLQHYLGKWQNDDYNVGNLEALLSAIRDDILTMLENDFAVADIKNEEIIVAKLKRYRDLYTRQGSRNPSLLIFPYSQLITHFSKGKIENNWELFNKACFEFQVALVHLELYRCDYHKPLTFRPSLKLMTQFARMRHQFPDFSSGKIHYHALWEKKGSQTKQLSLLYPTVGEFFTWLDCGHTINHAISHLNNVPFNKLVLTEKLEVERAPINNINSDGDDKNVQLQQALAMSLKENREDMENDDDDNDEETARAIALSLTGRGTLFSPDSSSSPSSNSSSSSFSSGLG